MKLQEWLQNCPDVTNVKPVQVTLGKPKGKQFVYSGCSYIQRGEERLYLVGKRFLPKRKASCFLCNNEDWFVAGYIDEVPKQFEECHPFGPNFLMMKWTVKEPIDMWEPHGYERIPMTIELVEE